jgi:hypothetical protein
MCENGPHQLWVVFDIEDCLLKLAVHCLDGLEGVVLEDFLADFIPQTFLRVAGRREEQRDVVRRHEIAAAMVGRTVEPRGYLTNGTGRFNLSQGLVGTASGIGAS